MVVVFSPGPGTSGAFTGALKIKAGNKSFVMLLRGEVNVADLDDVTTPATAITTSPSQGDASRSPMSSPAPTPTIAAASINEATIVTDSGVSAPSLALAPSTAITATTSPHTNNNTLPHGTPTITSTTPKTPSSADAGNGHPADQLMRLLDVGTTPSPPYRLRSALGKELEEDDELSSPPPPAARSVGGQGASTANYVPGISSYTAASNATTGATGAAERLSSLNDAISRLRAASQIPTTATTTTTGAGTMQFNHPQPPSGSSGHGGSGSGSVSGISGSSGGIQEHRVGSGQSGYGSTSTTTTGKRGSPLSDRALMAALSRAQRGLMGGGGGGNEVYTESTSASTSRQGQGQGQGQQGWVGTGTEGGGGETNFPRRSALLGRMLVDRPPPSSQTLTSNSSSSSSSNAAAVAAAYAAIGIVPTNAAATAATAASTTVVATTTIAAAATATTSDHPVAATTAPSAIPLVERRVKTVDFAPMDVVHRVAARTAPATLAPQYPTVASTLGPTLVLPMSTHASIHLPVHASINVHAPAHSTHVTAPAVPIPAQPSSSSAGSEGGQGPGAVYFRRQLANFGQVAVGCMARQELGDTLSPCSHTL